MHSHCRQIKISSVLWCNNTYRQRWQEKSTNTSQVSAEYLNICRNADSQADSCCLSLTSELILLLFWRRATCFKVGHAFRYFLLLMYYVWTITSITVDSGRHVTHSDPSFSLLFLHRLSYSWQSIPPKPLVNVETMTKTSTAKFTTINHTRFCKLKIRIFQAHSAVKQMNGEALMLWDLITPQCLPSQPAAMLIPSIMKNEQ